MDTIFLMFRDAIDFAMNISYIEYLGISAFEVALAGFLAFTFLRFIVSPLLDASGGRWHLSTLGDTVKDAPKSTEQKAKDNYYSNKFGPYNKY